MNTAPTSRPGPSPEESGWYEIRLQGRLDPRWSARFEGMTMTTTDGCTLLTGLVVDQSALHGLLQQLRDIGLPLTSVIAVDPYAAPQLPLHPDAPTTGA